MIPALLTTYFLEPTDNTGTGRLIRIVLHRRVLEYSSTPSYSIIAY